MKRCLFYLFALTSQLSIIKLAAATLYSQHVAVLGDSISVGYDCQGSTIQANPTDNWATGTNTAVVQSVWNHLNSLRGTTASNYAISGDKMIDVLNLQIPLIDRSVDLVLIEAGANDICGYTDASLVTSNSTFKSEFQSVINGILSNAKPGVKIVVFSVPNIYNLWNLFHSNILAQLIWNQGKVCQPMLVNPTSTATIDVNRRAKMAAQTVQLNAILNEVCTAVANGQCIFDNNLIYNWNFATSDISTLDYFHPSCTSITSGQGAVATVAWNFLSQTVGFAPNTPAPSLKSTTTPTVLTSTAPSMTPSVSPSTASVSTVQPSVKPTLKPVTRAPSTTPISSTKPVAKPTGKPTVKPTVKPISIPSAKPSRPPSLAPK